LTLSQVVLLSMICLAIVVKGGSDMFQRMDTTGDDFNPFLTETLAEFVFLMSLWLLVVIPLIVTDQMCYMFGRKGPFERFDDSE